jgi:hypothetical protein
VWVVVEMDVVEGDKKMCLSIIPTLDSSDNKQLDLPLFRKQGLDGTLALLFPIVAGRERLRSREEATYRRQCRMLVTSPVRLLL